MGKTAALRTKIEKNGLRRDRLNNVSHWEFINLEPKGTRQKRILKKPGTNQTFLFKKPHKESEYVNELFNSVLSNELEIGHVDYFPAKWNDEIGVLCERFINPEVKIEELWEMKELLLRHSLKLKQKKIIRMDTLYGRDPEVLEEHNIENIFLVLEEEFGKEVFPRFFQMVGLDALIGHTDRHWENYGIVLYTERSGQLQYRFAPIYDTVSCRTLDLI